MTPASDKSRRDAERRMLPFVVEFVKFATGFAVIVAVALLTLHVASAAMG
ncbi:MAG TPA: hypothetical protein PLW99_01210 [Candidatus Paceibacterota bacterium]|nr:hypothetical protein [Candidatus Paceibacterota bacterium]